MADLVRTVLPVVDGVEVELLVDEDVFYDRNPLRYNLLADIRPDAPGYRAAQFDAEGFLTAVPFWHDAHRWSAKSAGWDVFDESALLDMCVRCADDGFGPLCRRHRAEVVGHG